MTHRPARRTRSHDERRAVAHWRSTSLRIQGDYAELLGELELDVEVALSAVWLELHAARLDSYENVRALVTRFLDEAGPLTDDEPELAAILRGAARSPGVMAGV